MLLSQVKGPFANRPGWTYEIKLDGYRLLASTGEGARLHSKNGADATKWFGEVTRAMASMPAGFVFDGEVVVLDEAGRTNFDLLHARARTRGYRAGLSSVVYSVFDVLAVGGTSCCTLPLRRRQELLAQALAVPPEGIMRVTGSDDGEWLFQKAVKLELEGVVAKRLDSAYFCGVRSTDWLKHKRKGSTPAGRFSRKP